jgi:hypothetical protein
MLGLTIVGTVATIISTVVAVKAKNEARDILQEINKEKNRNVQSKGNLKVKNVGENAGVINGINSGDIHNG